jgi:predicted phage-related endonuclease
MTSSLDLSGVFEYAKLGPDKLEDHRAWLDARRKYCGASEAAAIVDGHCFGTTAEVKWAEKVGIEEPQNLDHLPGVRMGRAWETIGGQVFCDEFERDTGVRVAAHRAEVTLLSRAHPFIAATPDYWLTEPGSKKVKGALEIKAPGWMGDWVDFGVNSECPGTRHTWMQIQQQMLVTGLRSIHVLGVGGYRGGLYPAWQEIEYDEAFVRNTLVPKLEEFWGYVEREECPPPTASKDWGRVHKAWRKAKKSPGGDKQVVLPADGVEASTELEMLSLKLKKMKAREQELRNIVRSTMGDAEEGYLPDGSRWKRTKNDTLRYYRGREDDDTAPVPW